MGCGLSKSLVDVSPEPVKTSCTATPTVSDECTRRPKTKWKHFMNTKESFSKFIGENSMPTDASNSMFELRLFLDENDLLSSLLKFANRNGEWTFVLLCWVDIQFYKAVSPDGFGQQKWSALKILSNYIEAEEMNTILSSAGLEKYKVEYRRIVNEADENEQLPVDLFEEFQLACFIFVYSNIWNHYRTADLYKVAVNSLRHYNQVDIDDFQYLDKLGEGGFGFVVHAVKKSTGKHYAMKVLYKYDLLQHFREAPLRVTFEKQAMCKCIHPFIVSLDYAFRTDHFAVMAMELGACGTLHDSLCNSKSKSKNHNISEERVRFYAAEIILGLSHMHKIGLMYRDLKPGNVLLMADGHIKLVDLGGAVDPADLVLKSSREVPQNALQFWNDLAPPYLKSPTESPCESASSTLRANTVVGTLGFMAPEVIGMFFPNFKKNHAGYTKSADYWSLGMTMIVLLTGNNPFRSENVHYFSKFLQDSPPKDYIAFLVVLKRTVCEDTYNIICEFIKINSTERLGYGVSGLKNVKNHKYFEVLDWDKLGQRLIEPPFFPVVMTGSKPDQHECFEDMVNKYCTKACKKSTLMPYQDAYFNKWDYVSHDAVKLELDSAANPTTTSSSAAGSTAASPPLEM